MEHHVLARIEQQPRAAYTRNLYVGPAPPEDDEDADWVTDYTLTVFAEEEPWMFVENGNKHPHREINTVDFVHDTAFHFSEDSSEDGDKDDEVDGPEDENKRHHQDPCCGLDCRARGLPCTVAMF